MDLRYVADTSSKQLFCGREMLPENWCYMVECSTCSTTSVHRCLHSMIEKWCGTCVLYSLQCGCCVPNLWKLHSLTFPDSLFSKQSSPPTLEEMSTTPAEQPLSQPTIYHIIKNKTVNQTKIGTLNGKRTKDKLCKRCQQHQRINPSTDQATTS